MDSFDLIKRLTANSTDIDNAVHEFRCLLSKQGAGVEYNYRLSVSLAELLNNILEHGKPDQDIYIDIHSDESGAMIMVSSKGEFYEVPKCDFNDVFATSGRGVAIVNAFSELYSHRYENGENRISVYFSAA